jgi:arsenate reductase-like glutaredoxin family protein
MTTLYEKQPTEVKLHDDGDVADELRMRALKGSLEDDEDPWEALLQRKEIALKALRRDPRLVAEQLRRICAEADELMRRPGAELKSDEKLILALIEAARLLINAILRILGLGRIQIPDFGFRSAIEPLEFKQAVEKVADGPVERLLALLEGAREGRAVPLDDIIAAAQPLEDLLTMDQQELMLAWFDRYPMVPALAAASMQEIVGGLWDAHREHDKTQAGIIRER